MNTKTYRKIQEKVASMAVWVGRFGRNTAALFSRRRCGAAQRFGFGFGFGNCVTQLSACELVLNRLNSLEARHEVWRGSTLRECDRAVDLPLAHRRRCRDPRSSAEPPGAVVGCRREITPRGSPSAPVGPAMADGVLTRDLPAIQGDVALVEFHLTP